MSPGAPLSARCALPPRGLLRDHNDHIPQFSTGPWGTWEEARGKRCAMHGPANSQGVLQRGMVNIHLGCSLWFELFGMNRSQWPCHTRILSGMSPDEVIPATSEGLGSLCVIEGQGSRASGMLAEAHLIVNTMVGPALRSYCGVPLARPCCLPVSSAAASHRPTPCPVGTFSSLPEQTMPSACQVCPRSFYCKEAGLQAPSGQCPAGERQ